MEENLKTTENEGISLHDIFFLIRKNILIILIITFVITIIGGIYAIGFKDTTYSTAATAMVVVPDDSGNDNKELDYSYALNLTHTFEDYVKSNAVSKRVAAKLSEKYGMNVSTGYVRNCVNVEVQQYSLIISISVSSTVSEEFTMDMANEVFDTTIYLINNELKTEETAPLANTLVVVDYSEEADASKGTLIVLVLSFLIGLVLSIAFVFIKYLLNDTYTSKEDFEKSTGVNVLVMLPDPIAAGGRKYEDK